MTEVFRTGNKFRWTHRQPFEALPPKDGLNYIDYRALKFAYQDEKKELEAKYSTGDKLWEDTKYMLDDAEEGMEKLFTEIDSYEEIIKAKGLLPAKTAGKEYARARK